MHGRNNNPRGLHEQHFTAHIGLYPSFSAFVAFYEHAIEKLYSEVSERNETADAVAIPLLFLMRHTMELGYKFSLVHLCELNSSIFTPELKGHEGHSLTKLHARLGSEFSKALANGRISARDREAFEEHYSTTEKGMKLFDALDERSAKLRFPNSDQTAAFPLDATVNLLELKEAFDAAMVLLGSIVDVIARPEVYYGG